MCRQTHLHCTPSEQHHPYSTAPPTRAPAAGGVPRRRRTWLAAWNSLSRRLQLNGASGLRVQQRQRKRVQELAAANPRRTMMASSSLGGGALACAVDSACCPGLTLICVVVIAATCLSHLASLRVQLDPAPKPVFGISYMMCRPARCSDMGGAVVV